jgi:hypothetical protein
MVLEMAVEEVEEVAKVVLEDRVVPEDVVPLEFTRSKVLVYKSRAAMLPLDEEDKEVVEVVAVWEEMEAWVGLETVMKVMKLAHREPEETEGPVVSVYLE